MTWYSRYKSECLCIYLIAGGKWLGGGLFAIESSKVILLSSLGLKIFWSMSHSCNLHSVSSTFSIKLWILFIRVKGTLFLFCTLLNWDELEADAFLSKGLEREGLFLFIFNECNSKIRFSTSWLLSTLSYLFINIFIHESIVCSIQFLTFFLINVLYKRVDTIEIQAPAGLGKIQLDIP